MTTATTQRRPDLAGQTVVVIGGQQTDLPRVIAADRCAWPGFAVGG